MEVSIFRNGEIWRAQIIIPKTTMNTVDLPPSNHKIRTIVLPIKDNETAAIHETIQQQHQQPKSEFTEANEYDESDILDANTLMTLTEHNGTNQMDVKSVNNANNKTWQFIESAIGEVTMVNDFYSGGSHLNMVNSQSHVAAQSSTAQRTLVRNGHNNIMNNSNSSNDNMNIETILQMQCELIDQQKELKSIEMETIEQLKMLHRNVSVLAKKFDMFEQNFNFMQPTAPKMSKSPLNKPTNNAIHQYRLNDTDHMDTSPQVQMNTTVAINDIHVTSAKKNGNQAKKSGSRISAKRNIKLSN